MMLIIYIWIGWILRDWYISYCIRYAARDVLGNEHGLLGDTLNHIRCMNIHSSDEINSIIDRLPIDITTDGSIIPLPMKKIFYRYMSMK